VSRALRGIQIVHWLLGSAWLVLAAAMLAFAKFHVFSCCDEERQVNVLLTLVCPLPIAIGVTYLVSTSAIFLA